MQLTDFLKEKKTTTKHYITNNQTTGSVCRRHCATVSACGCWCFCVIISFQLNCRIEVIKLKKMNTFNMQP